MNFLANPIISLTILSSLMKGNKKLVNKTLVKILTFTWASEYQLALCLSQQTATP